MFLHLALAGTGMWRLLRRHDLPEGVAVLGGCAFALSGFFAKHFGLPPFLATASWLPWLILATEHALDRPGPFAAGRLALVGAMTFLAGQPQIALMAAYATALFAVVRAITGGTLRDRREGARAAGTLLAAAALAGMIVAAQLLPTLELASRSARARLPFETVLSGAFHPVEAIRFLVPYFFGSPITRDEWSAFFPRGDSFYGRIQLNSLFAGTPVFLLALVGMLHPRTWRRALPFTVVLLVAALVAFGSPLARLAHAVLPGFAFARLDRAGAIVGFAQFVPAALAAAELARRVGPGRRALGAVFLGVAVAGAWLVARLGYGLPAALGVEGPLPVDETRFALERVPGRTTLAAIFAGATGLALLLPSRRWTPWLPFALAAFQLFLFAAPYRGDRRPAEVFASTPEIAALREWVRGDSGGYRFVRFGRPAGRTYAISDILPPSTNAPHGIRDVQGYNALVDRRLGDTLQHATGENLFSHGIWAGRRIVAPERAASLDHPLFTALSVAVVAADRPAPAPGWQTVAAPGSFHLSRNRRALPRVRLTATGSGVPESELRERLRLGTFDPAREVLWLGDGRSGTPGFTPRAPDLLVDLRNRLLVRTSAEQEAILVVADAWDPGWTATIDGRATPIHAAWGVVRAVVVPPGVHRVEMRYRPANFRTGNVLSLLGLALALASLALTRPGLEGRTGVP